MSFVQMRNKEEVRILNNDLISREALKEAIEQERQRLLKINPICSSISLNMLNKIIDRAPTVETYTKDDMTNEYLKGYNACKDTIQPTGEWIDERQYAEGHSEHAYICKKCGYQIIKNPSMIFENRYCNCCGAKIKGEVEND